MTKKCSICGALATHKTDCEDIVGSYTNYYCLVHVAFAPDDGVTKSINAPNSLASQFDSFLRSKVVHPPGSAIRERDERRTEELLVEFERYGDLGKFRIDLARIMRDEHEWPAPDNSAPSPWNGLTVQRWSHDLGNIVLEFYGGVGSPFRLSYYRSGEVDGGRIGLMATTVEGLAKTLSRYGWVIGVSPLDFFGVDLPVWGSAPSDDGEIEIKPGPLVWHDPRSDGGKWIKVGGLVVSGVGSPGRRLTPLEIAEEDLRRMTDPARKAMYAREIGEECWARQVADTRRLIDRLTGQVDLSKPEPEKREHDPFPGRALRDW